MARSRFQEKATKKELELSRKCKKYRQVFIKTGDTKREEEKHDKQIFDVVNDFPGKIWSNDNLILTEWNWNIKHLEIMSFYLV